MKICARCRVRVTRASPRRGRRTLALAHMGSRTRNVGGALLLGEAHIRLPHGERAHDREAPREVRADDAASIARRRVYFEKQQPGARARATRARRVQSA